jgi:hypothetical protein
MPAHTIAALHIGQGSPLAYIVAFVVELSAAPRIATNSA